MFHLALLLALQCSCSECVCEPPPDTSLCASPLAFKDGTVWKPNSDSDNKLVVIMAPQHKYDFCEAKLRDGAGWDALNPTGPANGDRDNWRGSFPGGSDYAGKKQGGGVRCFIGPSECFFPIPGAPGKRHE